MAGAALDPGSHVKKLAKDASDFAKFPDKSKLPQKIFTWQEVKQFDGEQGRPMYLVIDNNVYDFTDFADMHPAGPAPLKQHAGSDASAAMRAARMPSVVMDVFIHRFQVGAVDKPRNAEFEKPAIV
ncbi:fatty acid desaturase 2-like protein FADS2B [Cydia pomonella]|uniref:fatty acid desaturase 2-like protein FADS2B n=1 Tax=Cydia pomonella TaxID=82600 RepID=UPI002ADD9583|nr:fatty acid desaturase 2-like protein FADS2B [Cydia pomonella]